MAASAEGEGNHWPAFVDVLTAVIMVIIFLLVIMSGAVIMLSKRVVEQVRAEAALAHQHERQAPAAKVPDPVISPRDAADGSSQAELGSVLRQEVVVDGDQRLTIRTRETPETEHVAVKSVEAPQPDNAGVAVRTADTLIDVAFDAAAIKYDEASEAQVLGFLRAHPQAKANYEIWSFAPQTASVSEAQRLAFYRAVLTRNLLIQAGIAPSNIATQVRVTDPKSGTHNVRVVIKP